jgi:nitrate/TMAO reductase-like tetraheme cytochrome c subunit
MKNGKTLVGRGGLLAAIAFLAAAILSFGVPGVQGVQQELDSMEVMRADLVMIDTMKTFGRLERPPVVFLHDKHTEALLQQKQDCNACHPADEKGRQSHKFKRIEDSDPKAVMDLYHEGCITCHTETATAGRKSGPVTCGACHLKKPTVISDSQPMGMDKSLHYRHTKTLENKCEKCHHVYNEQKKTLEYLKGQEGSCRYCHGETKVENRIAAQQAFHQACIGCHQQRLAEKKVSGPNECSRCHSLEDQKLIEVVKDVPRMEVNQPNVVFVKRLQENEPPPAPEENTLMQQVPFDHKAHEEFNNTCRVCHHANLKACVSCHTLKGDEKGGRVQLEQSMHQSNAGQSCIGCHNNQKVQPECAGCHENIYQKLSGDTNASACLACHMEPMPVTDGSTQQPAELAALMLESRKKPPTPYPADKIPEIVDIGVLTNQFQKARMPHRKIVQALEKKIQGNQLAVAYHGDSGALCQGCHHNSVIAEKPPKCGSCHGQPFVERQPVRPGLIAAYHQQCIGCHTRMGIEKPAATDCTACHEKK